METMYMVYGAEIDEEDTVVGWWHYFGIFTDEAMARLVAEDINRRIDSKVYPHVEAFYTEVEGPNILTESHRMLIKGEYY